jgi:phosphoglycerate dehydrogenase-like enzyme
MTATVAVVDCGPGDRARLARLAGTLPTRLDDGSADQAQIVRRARGATVLGTLYTYTRVTDEVLAELPDLRLVVTRTAGYSHIDLAAAGRRGVAVAAVPEASAVAVAEYVLMTALLLRRRLVPAVLDARAGNWDFTGFRGRDLFGHTLGVVGLGAIGRRVAQLGGAFGMRVLGSSRSEQRLAGVEQVTIDALLEASDVVSLNVALTPETDGLLDTERIGRMRPGAILINSSRGEIVDLAALCDALREGRLAGAGLDVLAGEPVPAPELRALAEVPGLIITPHIAWHTEETLERQFEGMIDRILAFCAGRPVELVAQDGRRGCS